MLIRLNVPRVLPALIPLLLAGCASTQSVTEQNDALASRIDRLESGVRANMSSLDASNARDVEGIRRIDALAGEVERLKRDIAEAGSKAGADHQRLIERIDRLEDGLSGLSTTVGDAARGVHASRISHDGDAARMAALEARVSDLDRLARQAYELAGGYRNIRGEVQYSVTLEEDRALYPIHAALSAGKDSTRLDELIARLKNEQGNYHLEIQGHTDRFGPDDYAHELGRARAEAVKRYLNERGGIPLVRMSVISYGAAMPDTQGDSRRRVVILVMR